MDKRAFLAILLSLMVLVIYQEWVARYYGEPPPPTTEKQKPEPPLAEKPAPGKPAPSGAPVEVPSEQKAREIKVETDNYVALFTNEGARLKSFTFKKYRKGIHRAMMTSCFTRCKEGI
jgi:YidC/Oxa1 family membrane protein insertase